MKAVELLIRSRIPRDEETGEPVFDLPEGQPITKSTLGKLLAEVAKKAPDQYADFAKLLMSTGFRASYFQGETIGMDDLSPVIDRDSYLQQMDKEVAKLNPSDGDFMEKRQEVYRKYLGILNDETVKAVKNGTHNLGNTVLSGSRGNTSQLRSMLTTPGTYTDSMEREIPFFVRHGFNDGLSPMEFLASTHGTRKAIVFGKKATAQAGDIGKQLQNVAANEVVTEEDCGTHNAMDYETETDDAIGSVLARDTGGYKAGSIVTPRMLGDLRKSNKHRRILARSPLTCQAKEGICANCLGTDASGKLYSIGYRAGHTAGQAIGEPLAQMSLNTKHTSGIGGGKKSFGGLDVIEQVLQSPSSFPMRASVADQSGRVNSIRDADQGGQYVSVGDKEHYVLPNYALKVSVGDEVEAGDILSEGLVDTEDIINYRGLGEGRRLFVRQMKEVLGNSGQPAETRHLEVIGKAAINHIRNKSNNLSGGALPDDLIGYSQWASSYSPPKATRITPTREATGKYLEQPALHYSVKTQLTPRMIKHLEQVGFKELAVSEVEPDFQPEMVRLRTATSVNKDWLARLGTSYLKGGLSESAERGEDTDIESNLNPLPRLAVAENFGRSINQGGRF